MRSAIEYYPILLKTFAAVAAVQKCYLSYSIKVEIGIS